MFYRVNDNKLDEIRCWMFCFANWSTAKWLESNWFGLFWCQRSLIILVVVFFSLPSIFVVALCFDFFFWFKKSIFLVANRRSLPFQHTLRIISRAFVYAFIMLITPISTKSDLFFVVVSANEDRLSLDTHTHAHKQCVTLNVSRTRVPEIHLYAFCDIHINEIVIELQFMSKA